jgi:hypothetical protein
LVGSRLAASLGDYIRVLGVHDDKKRKRFRVGVREYTPYDGAPTISKGKHENYHYVDENKEEVRKETIARRHRTNVEVVSGSVVPDSVVSDPVVPDSVVSDPVVPDSVVSDQVVSDSVDSVEV